MDQYTKTPLHLQNFEVTKTTHEDNNGWRTYTLHGHLTEEKRPMRCPCCGYRNIHSNGKRTIRLKHAVQGHYQIVTEVEYTRWECQTCHACFKQHIPFKKQGHYLTKHFFKVLEERLDFGGTVKQCAVEYHTNKNLIKRIDKERLQALAGDMKPTHFSPFISIDEFSLHKNHQYATIVIDYCTGESLFVTQGKTYGQMIEFFRFVGHKFMEQVVAVSMDMNASYAKAFKELYPHIKIVYDGFHLIKNYNDMVLTETRIAEQRRLIEGMENALAEGNKDLYKELFDEYKFFKGSRYLILSSKKTLELKDAASKEHNRFLYEKYEKRGLKVPIGKHYIPCRSIERLHDVLSANEKLQTTYYLGEMLKASLHCRNQQVFDSDFKKWLFMAKKTGYEELLKFCNLVENHWDGIRNRVRYNMSNGPLEGTNCLIKNIRRQSYGIRDDEYFFLKIWEATRRHLKNRSVA